jgi:hypothetical protein
VIAKRKTIRLDDYEEDVVIKSLNMVRSEKLNKNQCDRDVSELMLKIMNSKSRKARRRDEAR